MHCVLCQRLIRIGIKTLLKSRQRDFLLHDHLCLKHADKSSWCLHLYAPLIPEWFEYHTLPQVNELQKSADMYGMLTNFTTIGYRKSSEIMPGYQENTVINAQ